MAAARAAPRRVVPVDLQHEEPRAHRDPVLLLVPDALGSAERGLHHPRVPGDDDAGEAAMRSALTLAATDIKWLELVVFTFFFGLVSVLGFVAARWRRAKTLEHLDEWGLGGRNFGSWISWF